MGIHKRARCARTVDVLIVVRGSVLERRPSLNHVDANLKIITCLSRAAENVPFKQNHRTARRSSSFTLMWPRFVRLKLAYSESSASASALGPLDANNKISASAAGSTQPRQSATTTTPFAPVTMISKISRAVQWIRWSHAANMAPFLVLSCTIFRLRL